MNDSNGTPSPGWYPDQSGIQRWWDGSKWTEHTRADQPPAAPPAQAPAQPPTPNPAPSWGAPAGGGYGQVGQPSQYGQPGQYGQGGQYGQAGGPGQPGAWGQGGPAYGGPGGPVGPGGPGGPGGAGKKNTGLIVGIASGVAVLLVVGIVVLAVALGGGDDEPDRAGREAGGSSATDGGDSGQSDDPGSGSGSGGADTPSSDDAVAVGEEYLIADFSGDYVRACELSSESYAESDLLSLYDSATCAELADNDRLPDPIDPPEGYELGFQLDPVDEADDEATYTFTLTLIADGEDSAAPAREPDGTIDMVVEDGEWRVDDENYGVS